MTIALLIIAWFVLGWLGVCLAERADKTRLPMALGLFGPFIFVVASLVLLGDYLLRDSNKPVSKLRRWVRGW